MRPSIRSIVEDTNDREDVSSDPFSTKCRTWVAKFCRALNSMTTSRCSSCIAQSCVTASSKQTVGWTQPLSDPRIRSQTLDKSLQDASTAAPALRTWQPSPPQHPHGRLEWASTQARTEQPKTPPPRAWQVAWPPRYGRQQQTTLPHVGGPVVGRRLSHPEILNFGR
jgi:hypothetical protein